MKSSSSTVKGGLIQTRAAAVEEIHFLLPPTLSTYLLLYDFLYEGMGGGGITRLLLLTSY
jgi:hypothetical protein